MQALMKHPFVWKSRLDAHVHSSLGLIASDAGGFFGDTSNNRCLSEMGTRPTGASMLSRSLEKKVFPLFCSATTASSAGRCFVGTPKYFTVWSNWSKLGFGSPDSKVRTNPLPVAPRRACGHVQIVPGVRQLNEFEPSARQPPAQDGCTQVRT